ncbi:MAG: 23S rRNA (uracil(1939)-C(5))-methyltransferase RlmD [Thaumarchaeota archaeon]|nr:MAG: 23S rRNA (uracil(1939)-C(5))-methyltransferase RlmD [Nitrososphaerota archaeon]
MSLKICKHFKICGGCTYLDKPYEEQLEEKVSAAERILEAKADEVHPSPKQYYYRNRMDFVVGEGPIIGLNKRGSWSETIDLEECLLQSPESDAIRSIVKEHLRRHGISGWNRVEKAGQVRFLTIIEGKFTGERMIFIVAYEDEGLKLPELAEALEANKISFKSLVLGINKGVRDDARAEELRIVKGSETILERIGEFAYLLHPNVFFQPNPYVLRKMIEVSLSFLGLRGGEEVLELFSGSGTFTIPIALKGHARITAVEADPNAVEIARRNLRLNKVKNVELINERAERVSLKYDYIIVDPPSSGLSYKLVKRLRKASPKKLLYISCNPKTLARDIKQLGYRIEQLALIDQFPQTPHIEAITLLKKP